MHFLAVLGPRRHEQLELPPGLIAVGTNPPNGNPMVRLEDALVAPWQLLLCRQPDGGLRVENLGEAPVHVAGRLVGQNEDCLVPLPCHLRVGQTHLFAYKLSDAPVGVCEAPQDNSLLTNQLQIASPNGSAVEARNAIGGVMQSFEELKQWTQALESPTHLPSCEIRWPAPSPATLARWLESLMELQRHTANSPNFYGDAVRAVVDAGGLDGSQLLVMRDGQWTVEASYVPHPPAGMAYDQRLIERAAATGRTVYQTYLADSESQDYHSIGFGFASPIFDETQQVVGVLYASRHASARNRRKGIRLLEALWTQVVAESVTAGVVRLKHETDAARRRVLLEQSFPASIVSRLERQPHDALQAEEREVTVLFVDLCDSSSVSDRLGPSDTYDLLADMMNLLTKAVEDRQGVVVDYYGDGLVAMWNAPLDQPHHAEWACRSALTMIDELQAFNARWSGRVGHAVKLGIGVHTGQVWVGNAGSRTRLKYGPRGLNVNIANRIEKATRALEVPLLISAATRRRLPPGAAVQRMGAVQLKGVSAPVMLFALHSVDRRPDDDELQNRLAEYEWALRLLEQNRFDESQTVLERLVTSNHSGLSLGFLQERVTAKLPNELARQAEAAACTLGS